MPRLESGWRSGQARYKRYQRQPHWGMPQSEEWQDLYTEFERESGKERPPGSWETRRRGPPQGGQRPNSRGPDGRS